MTSLHHRTARLREAVVPGWLADAMPDWLAEAVRPKPAPVPWGAMVRAALAICAPLAVGIVAGRRDVGLVAAIGGLLGLGCCPDTQESARRRSPISIRCGLSEESPSLTARVRSESVSTRSDGTP